jgi:hypothetical protein
MRSTIVFAGLAAGFLATAGCAALQSEMARAEVAYDQANYEESLVWLDDLEDDTPDMDRTTRARFYYLRGMTAFRLSEQDDALYYLSVAREIAGDSTTSPLGPTWHRTMDRTLTELTPQEATFRARVTATSP